MSTLAKAIELSAKYHSDTRDKGGTPYILHPIHVMMQVKAIGATEEELCAAIMHDLVEDTEVTLDMLKAFGFSDTVIRAVDSVTKREGELPSDYRKRVSMNPTGKKIKICDLKHNMDITRLKNRNSLSEKDLNRIKDYAEFYDYLVGGSIGV